MEKSEKSNVLSGSSDSEEEIHVYHLRIHDTEQKDAGEWKIEVKDKYGAATTTCNLAVIEPEKESIAADSKVETVSTPKSVEKGTKKLDDDDEEILISKVRIHDADLLDSGKWTCEVTDKYGAASTTCNLMVFDSSQPREEPRFRTSLWNETGKEGETFKLRCLVAGNPRPQIKWYKDNVEIPKSCRYANLTTRDDGTTILEIISLLASRDTGVYRCEAKSDLGIATTEAKLTVKKDELGLSRDQYTTLEKINKKSDYYIEEYEKAAEVSRNKKVRTKKHADAYYESYRNERNSIKSLYAYERNAILKMGVKWDKDQAFYFREHLKSKCVVEGGSVFLNCYVAGIPPFVSRWFKDGIPLLRNDYERHFIRSRGGYLSLEIPITELEDTGEYEVEVRNEQGRIRSQCYMQVEPIFDQHIEYKRPEFLQKVSHVHVKVGQTATFEASITGSPMPSVRWYKDGVDIQETSRVTMHHIREHNSYVLNIYDAEFDDIGLYKCEAHSWAGRTSSSAKLIVLEKGADLAGIEEDKEEEKKKKIDLVDVAKVDDFRPKRTPVDTVAVVEDMYMVENTATIFTKPPIFTTVLPQKTTVDHGESLFLSVETDGFPRPRIIWMRQMRKIDPESEGIKITDKGLEIQKANYADHAGLYTAKLTTGLRETESSCRVLVMAYSHEAEAKRTDQKTLTNGEFIPAEEKVEVLGKEELNLKVQPSDSSRHQCEESKTTDIDLRIPQVSPTGVHCHTSPLAKADKETELPTSKVSPHFSQPLDAEYHPLERDENVRMQCIVAGTPTPNVVWFKDGERLSESKNLKIQWDPVTGISAILLKRLHILDTGVYECFAYSENGCYKTRTTLHIKALEQQQIKTVAHEKVREKVSPTFISELKDKVTYDGGIIRLDCAVDGVPEPEIKWFKDGERVFPSRGKMSITKRDSQQSLVIENFSKEDEGHYTCEATSSSGTSSSTAYLSIEADVPDSGKVEQTVPVFTDKLQNVTVSPGGVAVFKCSIKGYPVPRVKWQKDMVEITQSNRITISNTPSGESTLTINNVTIEDSGMYVITAKNSLGREKLTASLIVGDSGDSTGKEIRPEDSQTPEESSATDDKGPSSENVTKKVQEKSALEGVTEKVQEKSALDADSKVQEQLALEGVTEKVQEKSALGADSKVQEKSGLDADSKVQEQLALEGVTEKVQEKSALDADSKVQEKSASDADSKSEKIADEAAISQSKASDGEEKDKQAKTEEETKRRGHASNVLDTESFEHFMDRKHHGDEVAEGIILAENEGTGNASEKVRGSEKQPEQAKESEKQIEKAKESEKPELPKESEKKLEQAKESEKKPEQAKENEKQTDQAKETKKETTTPIEEEEGESKKRDHASHVLDTESFDHFLKRKHEGDEVAEGIVLAETEESKEAPKESKPQSVADGVTKDADASEKGGKTDGDEKRDHSSHVLDTESMDHFMKRKHEDDAIADGIHMAEEEAKKKEESGQQETTNTDSTKKDGDIKNEPKVDKNEAAKMTESAVQTEGSFDFDIVPESQTENSSGKPDDKKTPEGQKPTDDVDLDQLVMAAEETLGDQADKSTDDISFEDVLAKSVIEESVTEAASEMDKIKSKRRRFSKSKKKSGSVDSEADKDRIVSVGSEADETDAKPETSAPAEKITTEGDAKKGSSKSADEKDGAALSKPNTSMEKSLVSSVIEEEVHDSEGKVVESLETAESSKALESVTPRNNTDNKAVADKPLQRVQHQVSQEEFASGIHEILDVKSLKLNETREAVIQQTTTCGKTQILEVSARRVSRQLSQPTTEETQVQQGHHHNTHHPPEILLPPDTQFAYEHTEIELTVKVRAAHGAKVTWYHDGQKVNFEDGTHYELFEEEFPIDDTEKQ